MKICYIGNTQTPVEKLSKSFTEKGHEVHLITWNNVEWEDVIIHNLAGNHPKLNKWNIPCTALRINKIIKEIKPDVLHSHYLDPYGLYGVLSGFHPHILSLWGCDILCGNTDCVRWCKTHGKMSLTGFMKKPTLNRVDKIHCISDFMNEICLSKGVPKHKTFVLPFGIDINQFKPTPSNTHQLTVICTRKMNQLYNIETIIKAIPTVLESVPNTHFAFIGEGNCKDKLVQLATRLGVKDNTSFIGQIPFCEMSQHLSLADVYVSPAISDGGLAQSNMEAMACELPVITTDITQNQLINETESGLLFELFDHQELAEKIILLLKDKQSRKNMGGKGRKTVIEHFDWDNTHKQMEKIYVEMIETQQIKELVDISEDFNFSDIPTTIKRRI